MLSSIRDCAAGKSQQISYGHQRPALLKRSALPITDTEEKLMASAAMSGLNNQPVKG
jgi:hypothetical protein